MGWLGILKRLESALETLALKSIAPESGKFTANLKLFSPGELISAKVTEN